MPYFSSLRSTQEWLRNRVRRDSFAWRVLFGIKQAGVRLHDARHAAEWAHAEKLFASALATLADRTPDFFFVQIGAHDGGMDDPLAPWIAARGWRGMFVEPQPEQLGRLRERYAGREDSFIFENVAIDREPGERPLYRVAAAHLHAPEMSGLASFFPDRALATHAALGRLERIAVPCAPLHALLTRHHITRVDLLQIDTEGYDAAILATVDFTKVRPALIHYEHRHLARAEHNACVRQLAAQGYAVHLKQHDAFAIRGD